ncbi:MAG: helix-turn-helix domain-containing protein [Hyphomicrobiaceae bacterium]|nr:MAG: helix-turn-helix domain-containing protein [Hyphomicrobiaceae bacterium]
MPGTQNALMHASRIRALRERHGLSQEELGEALLISKSQVSRLESGETRLNLDMARKIAQALDVSLFEVLGIDTPALREDAADYEADPSEGLSRLLKPNQSLIQIKTNVLSELGIFAGYVAVLDTSVEAIRKLKAMDPVVAQLYDKQERAKPTTLIRQFIPPRLLITNSRDENYPPINMEVEDARITGVIVSWHGGKLT